MKKSMVVLGVCLRAVVGWIGTYAGAQGVANSLTLSVVSTEIDINETFGASVILEGIQGQGQVIIAGLENFQVLGQSTSSSVQIINDQQSSQTIIQLQLEPLETGTFTLGPARLDIGGDTYESNVVQIEVSGDRLFGTSSTFPSGGQNQDTLGGEEGIGKSLPRYVYLTFAFVFATFMGWFRLIVKSSRKKNQSFDDVSESYFNGNDEETFHYKKVLPDIADESFLVKAEVYFRQRSSEQLGVSLHFLKTFAIDEICAELRKEKSLSGKEQTINALETLFLQAVYANQSVDIQRLRELLEELS